MLQCMGIPCISKDPSCWAGTSYVAVSWQGISLVFLIPRSCRIMQRLTTVTADAFYQGCKWVVKPCMQFEKYAREAVMRPARIWNHAVQAAWFNVLFATYLTSASVTTRESSISSTSELSSVKVILAYACLYSDVNCCGRLQFGRCLPAEWLVLLFEQAQTDWFTWTAGKTIQQLFSSLSVEILGAPYLFCLLCWHNFLLADFL